MPHPGSLERRLPVDGRIRQLAERSGTIEAVMAVGKTV
jgi:hypothetical protein